MQSTVISKIRDLFGSLEHLDSKIPIYLIIVGVLGVSYFATFLTPISELLIQFFALVFSVGGMVLYLTGES